MSPANFSMLVASRSHMVTQRFLAHSVGVYRLHMEYKGRGGATLMVYLLDSAVPSSAVQIASCPL